MHDDHQEDDEREEENWRQLDRHNSPDTHQDTMSNHCAEHHTYIRMHMDEAQWHRCHPENDHGPMCWEPFVRLGCKGTDTCDFKMRRLHEVRVRYTRDGVIPPPLPHAEITPRHLEVFMEEQITEARGFPAVQHHIRDARYADSYLAVCARHQKYVRRYQPREPEVGLEGCNRKHTPICDWRAYRNMRCLGSEACCFRNRRVDTMQNLFGYGWQQPPPLPHEPVTEVHRRTYTGDQLANARGYPDATHTLIFLARGAQLRA